MVTKQSLLLKDYDDENCDEDNISKFLEVHESQYSQVIISLLITSIFFNIQLSISISDNKSYLQYFWNP